MTGMIEKFVELPDWTFDVDEVSAGVFKVIARDSENRSIEMTGTDPEAILEQCKYSAQEMMRDKGCARSR